MTFVDKTREGRSRAYFCDPTGSSGPKPPARSETPRRSQAYLCVEANRRSASAIKVDATDRARTPDADK